MEVADGEAKDRDVKELWLDASITAVPFCEAIGWDFIERSMHGTLERVRTTKRLHHAKIRDK
jgi:hypothetical protein